MSGQEMQDRIDRIEILELAISMMEHVEVGTDLWSVVEEVEEYINKGEKA